MSALVQDLHRLLEIKKRLLLISLEEGTMLRRDDPEFVRTLQQADAAIDGCTEKNMKRKARRILGHIRQFNPFNTSDMEENQLLKEVIDDFLFFSQDQIDQLIMD